ncbi:Lrp/AsnC family transcriptional regulator [Haloarcula sp. S1CR25-12]|uniref:Lrp/AsnC family transcriptional regulator n=1 Tax=Haloarcula saliterrae TaxID=2950534 RepID=A0ABU2F832_9EURY|nr:Lrp/AsnC family transcriptional regulator [Haloarcula sp. S1CR25-12]MDS0258433.1 Lrp/AsnC family transcriptional regulator [Haloarcula sp. S1CR25-12]
MTDQLDDLDREILHILQVDARRRTDTDIGKELNVSGTTVANRLDALEEGGIIRGYHPEIDYEMAGYPLVVLFICTAPIADRERHAQRSLDVRGVVNVKQLLSGEQNLHIQAVAESTTRIEEISEQLDAEDLRIVRSDILSYESVQPWNHFARMEDTDIDSDT